MSGGKAACTTMPNATITVNGTLELGDASSPAGMGWASDSTTGGYNVAGVSVSGKTFLMDALSGSTSGA